MSKMDTAIRGAFRIKSRDVLPFTGFKRSNRSFLAQFMGEQGLKRGAEIGVQQGVFSKILCKNIPDIELTCVDPWKKYGRRITEEVNEGFFHETQEKLKDYNVKYMRMPSQDAADLLDNETLDFVYIDGLHDFDNVMMDLVKWTPKVRPQGIIAGHDYEDRCRQGVILAVNAYCQGHHITDLYLTHNHREVRSWFFVRK